MSQVVFSIVLDGDFLRRTQLKYPMSFRRLLASKLKTQERWCRRVGLSTPGIATIVELFHPPIASRWVGAPKGRLATAVGTKAS